MAEFLPHNSAIIPRFQSEFWPIFENHAIKDPAHLGILRVHGGSSTQIYLLLGDELFARAYAQWVTTKTEVPRLVNTLNFHRGQEHVLDSVQWQDSEFAQYIMPALDEYFTQV